MAKSWFGDTTEYSGPVPAGGYKCVIEEIERGVTGEQARTPGAKRYAARLRIVEPKKNAGTTVTDWFTVGTEDDPKARAQETWQQSLGAKKLFRLLKRAGVAARDGDDEEWMDAAQGQEVCAHITKERDETGQFRNRINGDYFKESDEDFVGIGELLEAPSADGKGRAGRAAGVASARAAKPTVVRARPPVEDDEEEDKPPVKAQTKPPVDEEEEAPAPSGRKGGRKVAAKADDEDDDED